jgi:hypothetical protein
MQVPLHSIASQYNVVKSANTILPSINDNLFVWHLIYGGLAIVAAVTSCRGLHAFSASIPKFLWRQQTIRSVFAEFDPISLGRQVASKRINGVFREAAELQILIGNKLITGRRCATPSSTAHADVAQKKIFQIETLSRSR